MVEMTETGDDSDTATNRSLILLDEMGAERPPSTGSRWPGRRSSTFMPRPVRGRCSPRHYHELTMLAEKLPRVRNLRVGVKEAASGIVFLHSIEPGPAARVMESK